MPNFIDDGYTESFEIPTDKNGRHDGLSGAYRPVSRRDYWKWVKFIAPTSPLYDPEKADEAATDILAGCLVEWSESREIAPAHTLNAMQRDLFAELREQVFGSQSQREADAKN